MKQGLSKKRLGIGIVLLLLVMFGVFTYLKPEETKAGNPITVRVYYDRTEDDYTGWSFWMWSDNGAGAAYTFAGTDETYGAYLDYVVDDAIVNQVGFLIRKGEWEEKDGDADRYIDISTVLSGRVDVYIKQGENDIRCDYTDAKRCSKARSITVDSKRTVKVEVSQAPENGYTSAFKIMNASGTEVTISSVTNSETTATITVSEDLDYFSKYELQYNGFTYRMKMPREYSSDEFESKFTYSGNDLGATWSKASTTFKVWAPTADSVKVNLYKSGTKGTNDWLSSTEMIQEDKGVWSVKVKGDLKNKYYTYTVDVDGNTREVIDPYARTSGINGDRGMVIDLDSTDPEGWDQDVNPHSGKSITDAVLYELHVKDFSWHKSSGITNKGKYIGFTETGTTNATGQSTGIDYLKDLGVTHIHLLPTNDFQSGDESGTWDDLCWGYDPKNYNIPDGMYATDAYDGNVRVKEYKQMVKALHDQGISVVSDVVFNHVASTGDFAMNVIVPDYFIRPYSNGTGCGNDVASERSMVRKYIVDSLVYWAQEYHLDGFRFDLAGILDAQTINEIVTEVRKIDPSIIFYGEGWNMYTNVTKPNVGMANQGNAGATPGFGYFSDMLRDAVKGGNFDVANAGYVNGDQGKANAILKSAYASPGWAWYPTQVINYDSAHDNYTLFDKLQATNPYASLNELVNMNNLAAAIVMTSQGVPFIHAGEELLRSKEKEDGTYEHNSYGSGPELNSIKYDVLSNAEYQRSYNYYKGLIQFRKQHAALRMTTYDDIYKYMSTMVDGNNSQGVIAYKIDGAANNDISDGIVVAYNPSGWDYNLSLPSGTWKVCVNKEKAGTDVLATVSGSVSVPSKSCMVLVQGKTVQTNVKVDSTVTVHFKSEWNGANLYYWDVLPNYDAVTWPGVAMTAEGDGWYQYTIPNATSANLIFNYDGNQTADLSREAGEWWYADGKWTSQKPASSVEKETETETQKETQTETQKETTTVPETTTEEETTQAAAQGNRLTVYYKNSWETTYVHYQISGGSWTEAPGVKMTDVADDYAQITIDLGTATGVTACFNDGANQWDNNNYKNYTIEAGTYTIENGTVTKGAPDLTPAANTLTVYYYNSSWSNAYIHYKVGDSAWTDAPGVKMTASTNNYNVYTIDMGTATTVTACFNNGSNTWDNNSNKNYTLQAGTYTIKNKAVTAGAPAGSTTDSSSYTAKSSTTSNTGSTTSNTAAAKSSTTSNTATTKSSTSTTSGSSSSSTKKWTSFFRFW